MGHDWLGPFGRIWEALGRTNEIVGRQGQELKDYIALGSQRDEYVAGLQDDVDKITTDIQAFIQECTRRLEKLETDLLLRQKQSETEGENRRWWSREFWLVAILAPALSALLLFLLLVWFGQSHP